MWLWLEYWWVFPLIRSLAIIAALIALIGALVITIDFIDHFTSKRAHEDGRHD